MLAGVSSTALIGVIQAALAGGPSPRIALLVAFFALALFQAGIRAIAEILHAELTQRAIADLRLHLARHLLGAPLPELERHGPSPLLALLTSDVTAIAAALARLPTGLSQLAVVASCLAYLAWLYWPAMVGAVIVMALGVVVFMGLARRAQARFDHARVQEDRLYEHLGALTRGTKELKLHRPRQLAFLDRLLRPTVDAYRRSKVAAHAEFAVAASTGQLLFFLFIGALAIGLPQLTTSASTSILTGYTLILIYLVIPLDTLTAMGPVLGAAATALARTTALARGFERAREPAGGDAAPPAGWQQLELCGVRHRYRSDREDREFTLGPLQLALRPGELVFVVGGNGSGKTTLAKLLVGLYTPEAGQVLLDGRAVGGAISYEAYRQLFTVVFSDFFLFEAMLGLDPAHVEADLAPYLRALHLDHKVRYDGGALSTLDLSSGQRKRLALLTALLEDRPIYVFDEWAADQDPAYKHVFYTELLPELRRRGKTVVAITHDDRYFHLAGRLIKMVEGHIESDTRSAGSPP